MNNGPEWMNNADVGEASLESGDLDRDLTSALRRVDAPAGFADRVMARALAGNRPAELRSDRMRGETILRWPARRWLSGAIAAGLIAGLFASEAAIERHRAEQRRVSEATAQFATAERITDQALAQARQQMAAAGVPLD